MKTQEVTDLKAIAHQVPLGFECRSCGGSAYNWLMKIWRFQKDGETCCADFRDWVDRAAPAARTDVEVGRE